MTKKKTFELTRDHVKLAQALIWDWYKIVIYKFIDTKESENV